MVPVACRHRYIYVPIAGSFCDADASGNKLRVAAALDAWSSILPLLGVPSTNGRPANTAVGGVMPENYTLSFFFFFFSL